MPVYQALKMVALQIIKNDRDEGLILRDDEGSIIPIDEVYDTIQKLLDGYKIFENAAKAKEQPKEGKNFLNKKNIQDYMGVLEGWYFEFSEVDEIIHYLEVNKIKPPLQLIVQTCRTMEGKSFADSHHKTNYFFKILNDLIDKARKKEEEEIHEEQEQFYLDRELNTLFIKLYPNGLHKGTAKTLSILFNQYKKSHGITIYDYQKILNGIHINKISRFNDCYPYVRTCIENYINPPVKPSENEVAQEPEVFTALSDEEIGRLLDESRAMAPKTKPKRKEAQQVEEKELSDEEIEQLLADVKF
ncbi:MAG: hypothetical protein Q8934_22680 [Bacillota bacterium]|nr:hypothetical protein [Bacillota bacterium]